MRFLPTITLSNPEALADVQAGQWINYEGARGRFMGRKGGCVWIAWGSTATKRFATFAAAFNA